jgi:hypothetical protein
VLGMPFSVRLMIFWARGMLSRRNFLYRVEYNWVQRLGSLLIISNSMLGNCAGGAKKKSDLGLNFFLIKKKQHQGTNT